jgi:hypothetical protein
MMPTIKVMKKRETKNELSFFLDTDITVLIIKVTRAKFKINFIGLFETLNLSLEFIIICCFTFFYYFCFLYFYFFHHH